MERTAGIDGGMSLPPLDWRQVNQTHSRVRDRPNLKRKKITQLKKEGKERSKKGGNDEGRREGEGEGGEREGEGRTCRHELSMA